MQRLLPALSSREVRSSRRKFAYPRETLVIPDKVLHIFFCFLGDFQRLCDISADICDKTGLKIPKVFFKILIFFAAVVSFSAVGPALPQAGEGASLSGHMMAAPPALTAAARWSV